MLSIIIPQYRTERWIRLCLRSLRRTQGGVQVIVVDNNSGDESIAYLRGVGWIELIENPSGSIGCSNGWRLEALRRESGASCHGIDPSPQAIAEGKAAYPLLRLAEGTADALPFPDEAFDLVIFGFCLYLCDRKDLFRIASEADRALREAGYVAILDFHPPFPYRNPYAHREGLYSYKMDYSALFRWNPAYTLVSQSLFTPPGAGDPAEPDDRHAVSLLRKDSRHAYPEAPFSASP